MNPLVSVIIPNYNHAPFLKERIDSVLNQTFDNFEVIILDDMSSDNSKEIIETYRNNQKVVHIEYNSQNSGSTFKQWEKGLKLAKGEWIWIAESDDVAHPDFLTSTMDAADPKISLVFTRTKIIDANGENGTFLSCEYYPHPSFLNELNIHEGKIDSMAFLTKEMYNFNHIVNASSVLFNKKFAPDIENFMSRYKLCGDWYFWIKVIEKGQIIYIDKELNYFRTHLSTVRNSSENQIFAYFENAEITNYIFKVAGNKLLKDKYSDYLIYIYFNRYNNQIRKGTFLKFLFTISPYGFKAILMGIKKRISNV
jgi:glycosyltransferase involved in cell wall biosynthesis